MKKIISVIVAIIVAIVCIAGAFWVRQRIEKNKEAERMEQLRQQHIELEQMVEDFVSMLPANFRVQDPYDVGYISNLTISVDYLEEGEPKVPVDDYEFNEFEEGKELYNFRIEMKPSLGKYSKKITYCEGPAVLGTQGLLATCKWVPILIVMEGEKNFITTENEKRYAERRVYLDDVNLETGEVKISSSNYFNKDGYVLVKDD